MVVDFLIQRRLQYHSMAYAQYMVIFVLYIYYALNMCRQYIAGYTFFIPEETRQNSSGLRILYYCSSNTVWRGSNYQFLDPSNRFQHEAQQYACPIVEV